MSGSRKHLLSLTGAAMAAGWFAVLAGGCGYTAKTGLPDPIHTLHVAKVVNRIDIAQETSTGKVFPTYRPGLEVELRNAMNDRVIFDGHFELNAAEKADAVLTMELRSFEREPMRYNANDTIQEFRIHIRASAEFKDRVNGKVIWSSSEVSGDATYFLSGERAQSEDEAVEEALKDLTRLILEGVLETW